MTAREVLDGIKGRLAAATPWPWEVRTDDLTDDVDVVHATCGQKHLPRTYADAELIANAPVDVARLTRAVEAVLELHVPVMEDGEPVGCSCCDWESEGNWGWPCATLAAIENALNPKEGQ